MGVLAIDFCRIPPHWADHEGRTGQAQDGWWGIPRDRGIAWDQDEGMAPDRESSEDRPYIAHPAQAVDSMPPTSAGTALFPLFRRVFTERPGHRNEWLILLLPAGTPPRGGAFLRSAARRAGWPGPVFLVDGAVALALGQTWKDSPTAAIYTVLRDRVLGVEGSLITIHASGNTVAAELVYQCRREEKNETIRAIREAGRDIGALIDCTTLESLDDRLSNVPRMVEEILNRKWAVEISRRGVLGLRVLQWGLRPLIREDAAITTALEYEIRGRKEKPAVLEFWYGYNTTALHPLAWFRLTQGRSESTPDKAVCRLARQLNGEIHITVEWATGNESQEISFPILWT